MFLYLHNYTLVVSKEILKKFYEKIRKDFSISKFAHVNNSFYEKGIHQFILFHLSFNQSIN